MASTPDCRVASASLSVPAGFTGHPLSSNSSPFLAADELLQRQLDELVAIHRQLRGLLAPSRSVADPERPPSPRNGDFLLIPELWRLQRAVASLEAECGTLVGTAQARLNRARIALGALQKGAHDTSQRPGEVDHVRH